MPLRAVANGFQTGVNIAAIPVREVARALSSDVSPETLSRRCWRGRGRAWIEVRGIADAQDGELGDVVLEAIRAHPGVTSARLNYPAGEVLFAVIGSAITGTSPLNARQLLLVKMMTDALPAAALAVSKPSGPVDQGPRGPDQPALWRAVAIRGVTTAAATTPAWAMASATGRPQGASTVALVALVGAELGQTLLDSRALLVVLTAVGSLGAMRTLISIPVVSQLLDCTPLSPIGWGQALGAAAAATIAVALLNGVAERLGTSDKGPPDTAPGAACDESSQSPRCPHATAAHKAAAGAQSAQKLPSKLSDRPGRRSSTYVRR
jgi:cation-transporting ATPase I